MSSDKSDKYIKEALHDYESPVDAEALWQAVQPPRRRRAIWWWVSGALALLLSVGGWLWMTNTELSPADRVDMEGHAGSTEAETAIVEMDAASIDLNKEMMPATATKSTHSSLQHPQTTTQHSNTLTATNALDKSEVALSPTNEAASIQVNNSNPAFTAAQRSDQAPKATAETRLPPYEDVSPNAQNTDLNSALRANSTKSSMAESIFSPTENATGTTIEEITADEEVRKGAGAIELGAKVELLPTLAFQLSSTQTEEFPVSPSAPAPLPQVNRKSSPWSAQLNAGLYRLSRSFVMNDSLAGDQLDFRRQTEQPLEAVSAEISLVYEHPSQFRLRTGLGWTSINTVFENNQMSSRVDTVNGVQTVYINPDGDSTFIEGPIAAYQTILFQKKHHNRIQHWDIPLLLAYQWSVGSWQFLLEGGVRFNLSQQVSGEVLDPELNRIDLSTADRFQTRIGLSYQGGVGVGYKISPRLSLRADMNLRYFPKDFTQTNAAIGERYQLLGGQLGVQYRF